MREDPAGDLLADVRRMPEADLITAMALAAGLFPEERVFTPVVPASRCEEGSCACLRVLPHAEGPGERVHLRRRP